MARLRRVDCSGPGFSRRRAGRGFIYLDQDGNRISDPATLERIKSLVIPPAWQDVWISPWENGHLQAVGLDAAGRKQYLYHSDWRVRRDQEKFDHMIEFARSLPAIRETTSKHLRRKEMDFERVLACAVRLLDRGLFRVGMERYSENSQSFGLATMRKSHVTLGPGGWISFDYLAKGSKRHMKSVVDSEVYKVVETLKKRRGRNPELLAYRAGGKWVDVKSGDINSYIREVSGEEFTAKDFRTWNATVLAAVALAVSGSVVRSKTARKRAMTRAVQEVSHYLGNTPAVCRKSYIDPKVFDRYRAGVTIAGAMESIGEVEEYGELFQGAIEEAVLDLLTDTRSDAIEKVA